MYFSFPKSLGFIPYIMPRSPILAIYPPPHPLVYPSTY